MSLNNNPSKSVRAIRDLLDEGDLLISATAREMAALTADVRACENELANLTSPAQPQSTQLPQLRIFTGYDE